MSEINLFKHCNVTKTYVLHVRQLAPLCVGGQNTNYSTVYFTLNIVHFFTVIAMNSTVTYFVLSSVIIMIIFKSIDFPLT